MRLVQSNVRTRRPGDATNAPGPADWNGVDVANATHKSCSRCGEEKSREAFKQELRYKDGLASYCRACHSDYAKAWQKRNPERAREISRRSKMRGDRNVVLRKYSLTEAEYLEIHEAQGGLCAICRKPHTGAGAWLHVDHDHDCCGLRKACPKCVRGLLCGPCNTSLHALERNEDWHTAALAYLEGARRGPRP